MIKRIDFNKEVEIGYIQVIKEIKAGMAHDTEELEVNSYINLDLDKENRIIGLEIFRDEANVLKNAPSKDDIYIKNGNMYSLRLNDNEVVSRYSYLGIEFCFSEENYRGFIGFDILDITKYPENTL
ncbi:DUF2283 domain-containing protein (plasmid) [Priestia flexa]|uniref:DUF2283 domain-containing protein n=1 Tax=Priestia flexa TaxID=86664 RepID=UPI00099BABE2|nr:DUF2283 domain-containing protein [Priestia flexa]AQX56651.1 hypothetical protein BC359_20825 [Priestia flexa]AQX56662.1 hypothetical protein BC359_20885 [Priestia flexa]AQX56673.1 hypothetical protein BC359_20945 [Priestia flexa]WEZ10388.1 DUF2283 domain-containing protein [Priestia flexa]